jgi:hypothetical protein
MISCSRCSLKVSDTVTPVRPVLRRIRRTTSRHWSSSTRNGRSSSAGFVAPSFSARTQPST